MGKKKGRAVLPGGKKTVTEEVEPEILSRGGGKKKTSSLLYEKKEKGAGEISRRGGTRKTGVSSLRRKKGWKKTDGLNLIQGRITFDMSEGDEREVRAPRARY